MRRQRAAWLYLVIAILLSAYGGFFTFREYKGNRTIFIFALIAFIFGLLMLALYLVFYIVKNIKKEIDKEEKAPVIEEPSFIEEEEKEEVKEYKAPSTRDNSRVRYTNNSYYDRDDSYSSRGYVKQVGYGPILEINGNRIRDMRNNQYYRIEGDRVYVEGGGVIYDISSNRIRSIYGSQMYEISGSNINKVFGGFYASISGNYITKYDLSEKYEITAQFSNKTLLLIAVLVFGEQ